MQTKHIPKLMSLKDKMRQVLLCFCKTKIKNTMPIMDYLKIEFMYNEKEEDVYIK